MDDVTFENPTFDPDGPGEDDDFDLPDPPMEPPLDVQQLLNASGDNLQSLQEELREAELETQKRLVDSFYNEVRHTYGMRPEGRIDYSQFGIDPDGKTLYLTPEDKKISIAATRGKFRFLGLNTLVRRYGAGGLHALRGSLGLLDYRSGASRRLGREVVETLQSAEETLPTNIEAIELKDLSGVADTTSQSVEDVETALKTINDPQIDVAWIVQTRRELAGVWEAMTRSRDELANNLAKLSAIDDRKSEVEKHLARERRKLTETGDTEIQQDIRDRMEKLKGELSDIELERQARLEALRIEQLSGRRSAEFVRPSGGSSMKTRRWLYEFELSSSNRG